MKKTLCLTVLTFYFAALTFTHGGDWNQSLDDFYERSYDRDSDKGSDSSAVESEPQPKKVFYPSPRATPKPSPRPKPKRSTTPTLESIYAELDSEYSCLVNAWGGTWVNPMHITYVAQVEHMDSGKRNGWGFKIYVSNGAAMKIFSLWDAEKEVIKMKKAEVLRAMNNALKK